MIDIHAPITIHQFDESRYARMEVALATQSDSLAAAVAANTPPADPGLRKG